MRIIEYLRLKLFYTQRIWSLRSNVARVTNILDLVLFKVFLSKTWIKTWKVDNTYDMHS